MRPRQDPAHVVLIHGLLGSGRNWRTWSRKTSAAAAQDTRRCAQSLWVKCICLAPRTPCHTGLAELSDGEHRWHQMFDITLRAIATRTGAYSQQEYSFSDYSIQKLHNPHAPHPVPARGL
jgi:hypothetical protein